MLEAWDVHVDDYESDDVALVTFELYGAKQESWLLQVAEKEARWK